MARKSPPLIEEDDDDEETRVEPPLMVAEAGDHTDIERSVLPDSEPELTERYSREEVERSMRLGLITPLPDANTGLIADPSSRAAQAESFEARYERLSFIGEGGMGEVALYKDRHIGREVALKTLQPEHAHLAVARERFIREARIQGQLEHPAIVPVYDTGKGEDGQLYFTMRRIHGTSLADVIAMLAAGDLEAAARFTPRRLLSAFATICLAVDMAHRRGVLHRDLKPANIMLGEFGEVLLLDWGLAKLQNEPTESDQADRQPTHDEDWRRMTAAGAVVGTLGYMPPEQLRAEGELTLQADIYSLGAILFEICTLEPLHAGQNAPDVVASTLAGPEARPSIRRPEREVPYALEEIIVRAVSRDPAQRYTARALHDAVEEVLDTERDVERGRVLAEHHARRARRHARKAHRDLDERRRALREVWRALAMDPENRTASSTVSGLLLEIPEVMPPHVQSEAKKQSPLTAWAWRFAIASYVALAIVVLVVIIAGNPGWVALFLMGLNALLAVATSIWLARQLSHDLRTARLRAELLNWHVAELLPTPRRTWEDRTAGSSDAI